jgi:hypothetical protein
MAEIVIKLVNGELAGKTAQSIAKEITAAAQAAKKAEIGTKEWIDAHARLDKAKQQQQDLTKQINSTKTASDQLKAAWNSLPGAGFFNQIGQSLSMAKQGVGGLVSSFGVLKGAIISTGIGALVVAVGTLVDWFTRTDEGATLMAGAMRGLEMIFDKLTKTIRDFGGWLMAAFENPKKAVQDFIDFLKDQAINRFKAFGVAVQGVTKIISGDFKEGMKDIGDAVGMATLGVENITDKMAAFGKEIADTVQEGIALEQELDRIEDRARELSVFDAQAKKSVEQLLLQSKNVGKTYEERIALLDKAGEIELTNHRLQLANAIDLEKVMKSEVDGKAAVGKVSDKLDQQFRDAQIARINLERESISLQEKIANRRTALSEKEAAEREKDLEHKKNLDADYLKEVEALQNDELAAKDESRNKDLEELQLHLLRQIQLLDMNSPLYAERLAAMQELGRQKRDEINQKWDQYEQDVALQRDLNNLTERYLAKQITEEQFASLATQRSLQFEQARLDAIAVVHGKESKEYQDAYGKLLKLKQDFAEKAVALDEELAEKQVQAVTGSLNVMAGFMGSLGSLFEQGTAQYKAFAVAAAVISTIEGAINAYTSALKIPYVGQALAPIAAAGALAAGYARVRQIQNTKISSPVKGEAPAKKISREKGGMLFGPRHSQGGIPIEAEGGEFIFSRKAVQGIGASALQSVNDYYTKFATGGPVDPFSTSRTVSGPVPSSLMPDSNESLVNEFRAFRNEVVSWQRNLKVYNVAQETAEMAAKVQNIRSDADV